MCVESAFGLALKLRAPVYLKTTPPPDTHTHTFALLPVFLECRYYF